MNSNYKKLGDYIQPVNRRNTDLKVETLLGVSIQKILMPSIANTVGTNMKTYKIIVKNQFAYGPVTSRNGDKISIALLQEFDEAIISQAYTVFEVVDTKKLHPEYLMMWFRRPEFDRYARFKSHGSARETFDWDELCEVELPIPSIEKQREIVNEYNTVTNRIKLNEQLNQKLEETAQALYKHWFVDFEFPNEEGKPYKSSGGEMVYNEELDMEIPKGWEIDDFQSVTSVTSGKGLKSNLIGENPIYGAGGITGYTSKWLFKETILITGRVGTHGKVFIEYGKCWPTDNTLVLIPSFLYYSFFILKTLNFDELNKGGVQALLTQTDIKQLKILKPIVEIEKFENLVSPLFKRMENNLKKKSTLNNLKDLILSKMTKVEVEKEML